MSFTLIERCRSLEEEVDGYANAFVLVGSEEKPQSGAKELIVRDHKFKKIVDQVQGIYEELAGLYTDEEGIRKKEVAEMGGPDAFTSFYDKLALIRRVVKKGTTIEEPDSTELVPEVTLTFSGEEGNGRYLDLFSLYNMFENIPGMKKLEYLVYLNRFPNPEEFRREPKRNRKYLEYIEACIHYLLDFTSRIDPLRDLEAFREVMTKNFGTASEQGIPGWEKEEVAKDLEGFEKYTQNAPKKGQEADGGSLFCEACKKSFANANVFKGHLNGKKHKRNVEKLQTSTETRDTAVSKEILDKLTANVMEEVASSEYDQLYPARTTSELRIIYEVVMRKEWVFRCLCETLHDIIVNTRIHAEKKSLRTRDEILEDIEMEDMELEGGLLNDPTVANLLNLPLGWDGKPIPLWLYKLHGLSKEFKCEICGGESYFGPRAFEQHFQQAKHTEGMRMLGIQNSSQFIGLTKIDEVIRFNESLSRSKSKTAFNPRMDEEIEDADGNVYDRKTYDALVGQNYRQ